MNNHHQPKRPTPPPTDLSVAQSLNKESAVFKAEAIETLHECRATLEKTQRFNDQAMFNQRKMVFALNSLLPSPIRLNVNFDLSVEEFTAKLEEDTAAAVGKREIFDIVHAINVLAMANTDVIHIFTHFMGHVNTLEISANRAGTNYQEENRKEPKLVREHLKLSREGALEKLLSIESQLTELIIEAREEAEAKAEVEA
ncbi:hypothetical protein [Vibrio splendidus]|uniref:hypothetical protein n=1 Tax=Vibrio splendidus TaxID=29497 RepID=UPI00352D1ACA